MESGQRVRVAEADDERRRIQAAEATLRREVRDRARTLEEPTEKALLIEIDYRAYDPVLHRANPRGLRQVIEDYIRAEILRAARH